MTELKVPINDTGIIIGSDDLAEEIPVYTDDYCEYTSIDPATLENPPLGKIFFGVYNNKIWEKFSTGEIVILSDYLGYQVKQKIITVENDNQTNFEIAPEETNVINLYINGVKTDKDSEYTIDVDTHTITWTGAYPINLDDNIVIEYI